MLVSGNIKYHIEDILGIQLNLHLFRHNMSCGMAIYKSLRHGINKVLCKIENITINFSRFIFLFYMEIIFIVHSPLLRGYRIIWIVEFVEEDRRNRFIHVSWPFRRIALEWFFINAIAEHFRINDKNDLHIEKKEINLGPKFEPEYCSHDRNNWHDGQSRTTMFPDIVWRALL